MERVLEVLDEQSRNTGQPDLIVDCLESIYQRLEGLERIQFLQAFVLLAVDEDEVRDVGPVIVCDG